MFNDKLIREYQEVKAPEGLEEKVRTYSLKKCAAKQMQQRRMFYMGVAAAICCVTLLSAFLLREQKIEISVYGTVISEQPIQSSKQEKGIAVVRESMADSQMIPVELEVCGKTKISVSDGTMRLFDADNEQISASTEEIWIENPVRVEWSLSAKENRKYEMMLQNEKMKKIYIFIPNETDAGWTWTIYQEKN